MASVISFSFKAPDFDCVCFAQLGELESHNLRLECKYDPRGAVYYRLKFTGTTEQKTQLEIFLSDQLSVCTTLIFFVFNGE